MENFISMLNTWPVEAVWVIEFFVIYFSLLLMMCWFDEAGIYVFMVIAIITANILVLKPIQFSFSDQAITLGTTLFTANFLATDILTEYYGVKSARRAIAIGFAGYLLFALFMIIGMSFAPATAEQAGPDLAWALPNHDHIKALFMPAPAMLFASMTAYAVSQLLDVTIFMKLRQKTAGKHLWLRNNLSTLVSSFIDLLVFGTLAFYILSSEAMPYFEVLAVFIIGPYFMRILLALADTPFIYLAKYFAPQPYREN